MVKRRNRVVVREEFLYAHELFDEMPKRSMKMSYEPYLLQHCILAFPMCINEHEPSICINCALRSSLRKSRELCD